MMNDLVFPENVYAGILLGVLASVILFVGKGIQRMGAETLGKDILKKFKTDPAERKKIMKWLLGTIMVTLSTVIQFAAQMFLDRSSTYVALGGIGILALIIFAYFTLDEHLKPLQLVGISAIIMGTILLGFNYEYSEMVITHENQGFWFFTMIIITFGFGLVIGIWSVKRGTALLFGLLVGIFLAYGAIALQFSINTGSHTLSTSLANWWFLVSLIVGQGSFWVTQYSFKKGCDASIVVPSANSFQIIIPFLLDGLVYDAPINQFQVFAFVFNVLGIILLAISSRNIIREVMGPAGDMQGTINQHASP
ncbi:MAG: hypothetical protein ACTSRA_04420 [Promethearchaeota archaeon]